MSSRPRSVCAADTLAAALRPIVQTCGKSWIRYDESERVHKTVTDADRLLEFAHVSRACYDVDATLCFKRGTVTAALEVLAAEFCSGWRMDQTMQQDWVVTCQRRLMNMLHIVRVNAARSKPPSWVDTIFEGQGRVRRAPKRPRPDENDTNPRAGQHLAKGTPTATPAETAEEDLDCDLEGTPRAEASSATRATSTATSSAAPSAEAPGFFSDGTAK